MSNQEPSPPSIARHSFRKGSMSKFVDMPKNEHGQTVLTSSGPRDLADQALRDKAKEMGVKDFDQAVSMSQVLWGAVQDSVAEHEALNEDSGHSNSVNSVDSSVNLDDLANEFLDQPVRQVVQAQSSYVSASDTTEESTVMANFCCNCGNKFGNGKFCSECGMKRPLMHPPK